MSTTDAAITQSQHLLLQAALSQDIGSVQAACHEWERLTN